MACDLYIAGVIMVQAKNNCRGNIFLGGLTVAPLAIYLARPNRGQSMSGEAFSWAISMKPDRMADKMVLLAYANGASPYGRAFASVAYICQFGCMDEKTVLASVKRLVDGGYLVDTGEKTGRSGQIKVYQLAFQRPPETGVLYGSKTPVFSVEDPQKRVTETPLKQKEDSSESSLSSNDRYSPAFLRFWEVYPAKVGKMDAQRKYMAARKALGGGEAAEATLQQAVEAYAARKLPPDRTHPNPATWLHQARYDDPANQPGGHNATDTRNGFQFASGDNRPTYLDPLAAAADADMA